MLSAPHGFLADHALGEEIQKGFVEVEDTEVPEHFRVKPGIEEMKDGVLDAADVLVHGHPVGNLSPVEPGLFVEVSAAEAVEVPGRLDEGVHGVRFPPGRAAAAGAGGVHEGLVPGQRGAALAGEFHVHWQKNGQVRLGNGDGAALFTIDDGNGGTPVPLP